MIKKDLINTKWDAREWTEDMKRKWQEKMFEIGFLWRSDREEVLHLSDGFYFLSDRGSLTASDITGLFLNSGNREKKYSDAFPETQTEQGQKHDDGKPRYDLLPPIAIDEMAKVMTFGAEKYAPDNWRCVDNAVERYRAALLRHSFAMLSGEELDPETGLPHAAHAMCCAAFLVELEA